MFCIGGLDWVIERKRVTSGVFDVFPQRQQQESRCASGPPDVALLLPRPVRGVVTLSARNAAVFFLPELRSALVTLV